MKSNWYPVNNTLQGPELVNLFISDPDDAECPLSTFITILNWRCKGGTCQKGKSQYARELGMLF